MSTHFTCRVAVLRAEAAEAAAPETAEAGHRRPLPHSAHAVALRGDGPSRRGHRRVFIPASCLPIRVPFPAASSRRASLPKLTLPSGGAWLHEIKHDGFRIIARKDGERVRLYSRPGNDLTHRFPLIVETLAGLRARSCIIDGEAVACDDNGVASFELIRYQRANGSVFLYAFDLIELNGDDLRRDPLEVRKATLRSMLAKAGLGLRFNKHIEGDGPTVFAHACRLGLEGIVSKRKNSMYRSGRSLDWLKMKNPAAPGVKREAEEDWS